MLSGRGEIVIFAQRRFAKQQNVLIPFVKFFKVEVKCNNFGMEVPSRNVKDRLGTASHTVRLRCREGNRSAW